MFTHLHVHTEYSLLDGMSKLKPLVKRAKELGFNALAITDHGTGAGLPQFYAECVKMGIKPILGCEVYIAPDKSSRFDKAKTADTDKAYDHLVLLVENRVGYKNLCKLITRGNTEGFYYKPRIDFDLLKRHSEGLICLSACVAGTIPRAILRGDINRAEEIVAEYKEVFKDNFYLEIQNHGLKEEAIVADEIHRIAKEMDVKIVCTNDVHYVLSEDAEAHEYLLCLQTGKKISEPHMKYEGDYSLKSEGDMRALFPAIPEAFDNTNEIAEKCKFEFEYGNYRMPKVEIPEEYGTDYFKYLKDEAYKGLNQRYPVGHIERPQAIKNLEYELGVVDQMGFAEYFLDTRKTIFWAREHGVLVGPGRGSGAGSTMNYCLKITDIDPIKYDLLFERFLNPERISMSCLKRIYLFPTLQSLCEKPDIQRKRLRRITLFFLVKIMMILQNQ